MMRWDCPCKESLRWDCPCKESFFRWKGLSMQDVEVGPSLQGVVLEMEGTVNARRC